MAVYSKPKTDFASGLLAYLEKQDAEPLTLFGEEIRQRKAPKKRSKPKSIGGLRIPRSELQKMNPRDLVLYLQRTGAGERTKRKVVHVWARVSSYKRSDYLKECDRIQKEKQADKEAKDWAILRSSNYQELRHLPYPLFLQTDYWKTIRKVVLRRDHNKCNSCGARNKLEIHHKTYENRGREHVSLWDLETLCHKCHSSTHDKPTRR